MLVATWNVNSVRARLPRLLPWLAERKPDLLLLQETKCRDEDFPAEDLRAAGYAAAIHGQKTYNGVAILAREPLEDVQRGFPGDPDPSQARVISARAGGIRIVSVYVVNGQAVGTDAYRFKLAWMARLAEHLGDLVRRDPETLVAGDFNVTFDDRDVYDPDRWREEILCSTPEREALRAILDHGLLDIFRRFHADGGHYTWWDFRTHGFQRGHGLRIDHALVTPAVAGRTRGVEIDREARGGEKPSDHAPLLVDLR